MATKCPTCNRVAATEETICRECGTTLHPGFPRQLVLLPLAFLVLVLALLFLAFFLRD
jgi:hypothetical protein